MASSYVNDLRLEEIADGEQSGTWGATTNTNLELIGEALGFGTQAITTNADTFASTVADGAADAERAMYIKYTGTLDSACTITIGPNTISRMHFIENGTSGSQNIIISQGSGANVTIPPGDTKAVYLDGAGSGAAVVDAFASLSVVDLKVQDDLTVTDDATIGGRVIIDDTTDATSTTDGSLQTDGGLSVAKDTIIGNDLKLLSDSAVLVFGAGGDATLTHTNDVGLTLNGTNKLMFNDASQFIQGASATVLDIAATDTIELTATNIAVVGTMGATGKITADAGIDIDNINIDGTTIALSSGDLTLDVAGDIILDADGGDIIIKDDGTQFGSITNFSSELHIKATINDEDIVLAGLDGGAATNALRLDMSDAGSAYFNNRIYVPVSIVHTGDTNTSIDFSTDIIDLYTGGSLGLRVSNSTVTVNEGGADKDFRVESNGNANMLFVDGGNDRVGIGTNSVSEPLRVQADSDTDFSASGAEFNRAIMLKNSTGGANNCVSLAMSTESNGEVFLSAVQNSSNDAADFIISTRASGARAERMRLNATGHLCFGVTTTSTGSGNTNVGINLDIADVVMASRGAGASGIFNNNSDGELVRLHKSGTIQGSISVSGTTVSYNAFSGSHWSRLTDNSQPTILRGTVVETIDEMMDWYQAEFTVEATPKKDTDSESKTFGQQIEASPEYVQKVSITLANGASVGDTVTVTYDDITYDNAVIIKEEDDKHVKCKISDTADSKKVYGVFANWDGDDDSVNDMYVTAVGTHVVRINKDVTVSSGDLLSSNGDGTAKVQDDDIIRSKTIGKVLANIKQETYSDGSYTVPCALYCG